MTGPVNDPSVADGDLVPADRMAAALTAAALVFEDGATQVFTPDGRTTYVDHGRPTEGEWSVVADGKFSSFWPPDYRATYVLRWIVEGATIAGLSFIETERGARFDGYYDGGRSRT